MKPLALIAALAAALLPAGGAAAATPKSLTAAQGSVTATVTWMQAGYEARDVHVTIARNGTVDVDRTLTDEAGKPLTDTPLGLTARDLDGDAEPEILLDLYSNGAHCCLTTLFFHYGTPAGPSYETLVQRWGNVGYRLVDLDRDGLPELRSADDRFNYRFSCYACSGVPIQIWQFRGGDFAPGLQDVTRQFPAAIRKDAAAWWKAIVRELRRKDHDVRGLLAAWAADRYLLHDQARVQDTLRAFLRRGDLTVRDGGVWPSGKKYVRALRRFLDRLGYDNLPA